jgi:hypothetical protein
MKIERKKMREEPDLRIEIKRKSGGKVENRNVTAHSAEKFYWDTGAKIHHYNQIPEFHFFSS